MLDIKSIISNNHPLSPPRWQKKNVNPLSWLDGFVLPWFLNTIPILFGVGVCGLTWRMSGGHRLVSPVLIGKHRLQSRKHRLGTTWSHTSASLVMVTVVSPFSPAIARLLLNSAFSIISSSHCLNRSWLPACLTIRTSTNTQMLITPGGIALKTFHLT